ncbi:MAG: thioredoxin domain-containing protein [Rhodocyclaceae bacterium]|nr:thioredoxin domain-containing protein [Rhodocyclaceae bacterium]
MPNRLSNETSPYLQQHADNPVDWWPWCDEALDTARREDRPILLSIGYSACHWCHVMAHESFEDRATADRMNRDFVNIKVDREERPDLDHIYQLAHQMLNGRPGGWPLTVFLAPDGAPFFSGTYFPNEARHGLPAFSDLLARVATAWREQREALEGQNRELREALARHNAAAEPEKPTAKITQALRKRLLEAHDERWGGFGAAPKFPHAADLDFLLRRSVSHKDEFARNAVIHTLERMAGGGIFDQLGGGFFRYSTDERWEIPHFEKMLYDNGPLLALYADAWLLDARPLFADVVERTARWVQREMQDAEGGYFAALDADSDGEEGAFYVWDVDLLRAALPPDQVALVDAHYGLEDPPNFEQRAWHLRVQTPADEIARSIGLGLDAARQRIDAARQRLFEVRATTRAMPGRDEKVLAAWNGMMVRGMARAGQVMRRGEWIESAQRALDFVRERMWIDGRLRACYKDGQARFAACLDDHAFLLDGALALLQAEYRSADMEFALALAEALMARFEDAEHGGFLFTAHDHEALLTRPREGRDGAMAAGNSVAALGLLRLGHLSGDERFVRAGERAVEAWSAVAAQSPEGFSSLMVAAEEMLLPPVSAVVYGPGASMAGWQEALAGLYLPHAVTVCVPEEAQAPEWLRRHGEHRVNGWVCWGVECLPPANRADDFIRILSEMVNAPGIS